MIPIQDQIFRVWTGIRIVCRNIDFFPPFLFDCGLCALIYNIVNWLFFTVFTIWNILPTLGSWQMLLFQLLRSCFTFSRHVNEWKLLFMFRVHMRKSRNIFLAIFSLIFQAFRYFATLFLLCNVQNMSGRQLSCLFLILYIQRTDFFLYPPKILL